MPWLICQDPACEVGPSRAEWVMPRMFRIMNRLHLAGDGPRPVRAGSGMTFGFWPKGVQGPRAQGRVQKMLSVKRLKRIFGCS
jgi:hypothetical protein